MRYQRNRSPLQSSGVAPSRDRLIKRGQRLNQGGKEFPRFLGGQDIGRIEPDELGFAGIGLPDILAEEPSALIVQPDHLNEARIEVHRTRMPSESLCGDHALENSLGEKSG